MVWAGSSGHTEEDQGGEGRSLAVAGTPDCDWVGAGLAWSWRGIGHWVYPASAWDLVSRSAAQPTKKGTRRKTCFLDVIILQSMCMMQQDKGDS